MSKVEIKADGEIEVSLNGERVLIREGRTAFVNISKPDRITVDMTEREAELVYKLTGMCGGDAHAICDAMLGFGFRLNMDEMVFDRRGFPGGQAYGSRAAYAHAERINFGGGYSDPERIRLTMDRDVAVTLRCLLRCLHHGGGRGELEGFDSRIFRQLLETGNGKVLASNRFTGTIRWKKKRLKTVDCEVGKTYRLVKSTGCVLNDEWEPV